MSTGRKQNRTRNRRRERDRDFGVGFVLAAFLLLAAIFTVIFLGFKFFMDETAPWEEPEYENVAVLPDYVISEASPYILIPYPEDNVYEVEMVFRDQHTGKEIYSTKRIRPGTVVRVEAMNFCKIGRNEFYVEVKLFDPKTWDEVESAVALETVIKRAEE